MKHYVKFLVIQTQPLSTSVAQANIGRHNHFFHKVFVSSSHIKSCCIEAITTISQKTGCD